jgi:hypothetical protein
MRKETRYDSSVAVLLTVGRINGVNVVSVNTGGGAQKRQYGPRMDADERE